MGLDAALPKRGPVPNNVARMYDGPPGPGWKATAPRSKEFCVFAVVLSSGLVLPRNIQNPLQVLAFERFVVTMDEHCKSVVLREKPGPTDSQSARVHCLGCFSQTYEKNHLHAILYFF